MNKRIAATLAAVLVSACGGGGAAGGPRSDSGLPAPTAPSAAVTFRLALPISALPSSTDRLPRFVSTATKSAIVTLTSVNGTAVPSPQPQAISITPGSGCTTTSSFARAPQGVVKPLTQVTGPVYTSCTFSLPAPVGLDTFVVATYDAVQTSATPSTVAGNLLSTGTSAPTTVVANAANNAVVTLNGVIASFYLVLLPSAVSHNATTTITLKGWALDADRKVIGGPGVFTSPILLTSNNPAFTFTPATIGAPSYPIFSIVYATTIYSGTCLPTTFTLTSGPATASAGLEITGC